MTKRKTKKISIKKRIRYIKFCPKCNSIDVNQEKSTMQSLGYLPTKYICNNCGYSAFNMPEIEPDKVNSLTIKNTNAVYLSEIESEKIDSSYGRFYVRVMWKMFGPASLIFGLIYVYFAVNSYSYGSLDLLAGIILVITGAGMCYIAFMNRK